MTKYTEKIQMKTNPNWQKSYSFEEFLAVIAKNSQKLSGNSGEYYGLFRIIYNIKVTFTERRDNKHP